MLPVHAINEFAELGALRMPEKLVGREQEDASRLDDLSQKVAL
jgi:hypothetical protein